MVEAGALVLGAVAEEVALGGVAVEIEEILEAAFEVGFHRSGEIVQCLDLRVDPFINIQELPIEILPTIARPEIPQNNPISIHHRHNPKLKRFQQPFLILQQLPHKPLQNMRRNRLPWMHPRRNQCHLFR